LRDEGKQFMAGRSNSCHDADAQLCQARQRAKTRRFQAFSSNRNPVATDWRLPQDGAAPTLFMILS
jgi:hypothetical protein